MHFVIRAKRFKLQNVKYDIL